MNAPAKVIIGILMSLASAVFCYRAFVGFYCDSMDQHGWHDCWIVPHPYILVSVFSLVATLLCAFVLFVEGAD